MNEHNEILGVCDERFKNIDEKLDQIIGLYERVGKLEQWRNFIMGAVFILAIFMIPIITSTIERVILPAKATVIERSLEEVPDASNG